MPKQAKVPSFEDICKCPELLCRFLAGVNFVTDGPDAGGKSSATRAVKEWLNSHDVRVYDLTDFQRKSLRTWPDPSDFPVQTVAQRSEIPLIDILSGTYDGMSMGEPPWAGGGWDLRMGVLQNLDLVTPREVVENFSSYRTPYYCMIIEPWLTKGGRFGKGGIILKERDMSTSLMYQPIMYQVRKAEGRVDELVDEEFVLSREGNKRALATPPSALFLMTCSLDEAINRLKRRHEKQDHCKFETPAYLSAVIEAYRSDKLDRFFEPRGTYVSHIDTTGWKVEDTLGAVTLEWETFLKQRYQQLGGSKSIALGKRVSEVVVARGPDSFGD